MEYEISCNIAHLVVFIVKYILINGISGKKSFSFLQDCAFISNYEANTNKWNIFQKSRFLFFFFFFCAVAHLLVMLKYILINGISCKKVVFLFARLRIY